MMKTMRLFALATIAVAAAAIVQGAATSDQSFVVIGDAAIELQENRPTLTVPTIMMELASSIESPWMVHENQMIHSNQASLASVELLAHQLGAPVYSELAAEESEHEVSHIEHALLEHPHHKSNIQFTTVAAATEDEPKMTALLETAPVEPAAAPVMSHEDAEIAEMEREVNMVELGVEISNRPSLDKKNDYAFLDDPKDGGAPTVLKNLKGLDIYVVNTPVADNDNEIRPVKPPHPMSSAMREKARLAAIMRKQLIHDIPQPKAAIKPKTRINTLSAYESSLVPSAPLKPMSRLESKIFNSPLVGGIGATQLRGVPKKPTAGQARFQQLPGTPDLPVFPKDPTAAPVEARKFGTGSSFDNRDGPPGLLDDYLPIKATLVEELDPLQLQPSKPNGW